MTKLASPDTAMRASPRPSRLMTVYAAALAIACWTVIGLTFPASLLSEGLFWIPLIAAANLTTLWTLPEVDVESPLGPIVIAATALILPPSAVALFAFVGALYWRELRGEATIVMSVFNRAMYGVSGIVATLAVTLVYAVAGRTSWQIVPAALAAFIAFDATNTVLLGIMLVVRRGRSWARAMSDAANPFPRFTLNATVSAMMSLLIVVLVRDVGRWSVVLIVIPLWLSHSAQRSARVAQDRAEELAARVLELEMLNLLSGELLSIHDANTVARTAGEILNRARDGDPVTVDLTDDTPAGGTRIEIPGAADGTIVVTNADTSTAVLEAAAALIGLTLTRLEVEAELAETERARTALTGQILEEATHERSRITMSMHDDVLPLFAAAQMQIDNAEMLLEMNERQQAAEVIERATSGVSDGIRSLRDTLEALRESTLVPGTAVDGVRRLMADLQARTGIRSKVVAPDPMPELPFAVELLAYETLRGCLANIEKHSQATTVHVEFEVDDGRLVLLMRDDGRGFDPAAIGERSHGLALMRQRAELARGRFEVSGVPGAGTTARLEVPTW